ncbi:MAG TPA: hypothetical protein VE594_02195 [Nitrososphaeraceae archaeon]|nr:hypothetical protein [Nitrososphaeraceae archaeon]
MSVPEAKFKINIKEGVVELEGKANFVDKHLDKFEEIFKSAIRDVISRGIENSLTTNNAPTLIQQNNEKKFDIPKPELTRAYNNNKRTTKQSVSLPPIPADLKSNETKIGLREFYREKKPTNHYEKTAVFVYYITKFNKQTEVKYGEILSCYEEVDEKKPSITDIIKNSIRYKGWLEQSSNKFSTRLTISGENFVKFDLPDQKRPQLNNQQSTTVPLPNT